MELGGNGGGTAASVCPVSAPAEAEDTLPLVAFHRGEQPPLKVMPAGRWRDWMNATSERFANRCLPLLMANQAGWVLLTPAPFTATWHGEDSTSSLVIDYPEETPALQQIAKSHFGYGILTYVFSVAGKLKFSLVTRRRARDSIVVQAHPFRFGMSDLEALLDRPGFDLVGVRRYGSSLRAELFGRAELVYLFCRAS